MLNSNHDQWNNPSQTENQNWDVEKFVPQGDAIYDYERVPAAWSGFDEQPVVYQYGDAMWQNGLEDDSKPQKRAS